MTVYLFRSSLLHLFGFAFFFILTSLNNRPKTDFYTIDFLAGIPGSRGSSAAADVKALADVQTPSQRSSQEPLPSLKRWLPKARAATLEQAEMAIKSKEKDAQDAVEEPPVMGTSRREAPARTLGAGGNGPVQGLPADAGRGQGGTDISADLSNFPFPWYLTRIRSSLWTQWSARMPDADLTCVVSFIITRNGSATDLSVSKGSGSDDFDYVAMSAVKEASPFPPLPEDFKDPTLGVHVKFRSFK